VSIWRHHTSRDGDPQLHVHAAVVNRVRCPDGVWRSLDSQAIASARPAAGAIAERTAEEDLSRRLGPEFRMRPDGIAREIVVIDEAVRDLFSSRRRATARGRRNSRRRTGSGMGTRRVPTCSGSWPST
jgi:conjugative relaxase-like TrwC/TraI family protein